MDPRQVYFAMAATSLLCGCTSVPTEYELPAQSVQAPASAGTSKVIFYSEPVDRGMGSKRVGIKVDGRGVAALSPGQYVRIDLTPGRHHMELSMSDTLEFRDDYALMVTEGDLYVRVYTSSLTANFDSSAEQPPSLLEQKPAIKPRR